uniref:Dilute domain-containing protein n=1 Tax=Noccaea caerulescens TaxID=107243 RepID=A0A1J3K547_NOCCA
MMKARTTNNVQSKRSTKSGRKDQKLQKTNSQKQKDDLDAKEATNNLSTVASSDSTTQSDPSEAYQTVDVRYLDDVDDDDDDDRAAIASADALKKTDKKKKHNLSRSVSELGKEIDTGNINADVWEDASNGALSAGSENEASDVAENKIEHLETRIERLEEELREVAALEISLYSLVPDHCSSAHKLHTPARRISRIYIHACNHFTRGKRATIARNSVSGLVLVARSCGNDVSRLTFWLSNIVALREIISQAFGRSRIITQSSESNGDSGKKTNLRWKNGFQQLLEDWQETETFTSALEKIEFWIFSRIVESVWWQVFTPHMQSPEKDSSDGKSNEKLLGPSLGDEKQGTFSISLWKNAFRDALQRLCPMRGAGHECGCLPLLATMVMEKCIGRFDVAMFNAILRESEHQIPTDPVSDPILDSKVLPIPAGDLSFGSGAQLKNAIGNWSRCLTEMFGINSDDSLAKEKRNREDDHHHVESQASDRKAFVLLNELSDLLMLPKDMLMERSIREEICPSISLPLIKRILCNFTPDEFCPDHVPGAVLEELNSAESDGDGKVSEESFPYAASSVSYMPPSTMDVAEKVGEAAQGKLSRNNVSMIQRKGYTSDEELEELDSPLTSIVDKSSDFIGSETTSNARYKLLREMWV